jgi:hypothetical protein
VRRQMSATRGPTEPALLRTLLKATRCEPLRASFRLIAEPLGVSAQKMPGRNIS